ncbi:MAG: hypothetical protein R3C44_18400 [Chloroflexota bacterium]
MSVTSSFNPFLIGLLIGATIALIGGIVEYVLHLRQDRAPFTSTPS